MVLGKSVLSAVSATALFLLICSARMAAQEEDPPARVARLNYLNGNVSMEPAGVNDWVPAELNRPFTIGDYLYTDQGGEAELHLDVAVIRMGSQTSFGFLNLDDRTVQLKATEGDLYIRTHNLSSDQVFEVDTPNAAVTLVRDGIYRFRIDGSGTMSYVVVREGQAEVTGGGQSFALNPENSATLTGTDQLSFDVELAPQPDQFDQWCQQRDLREQQTASARYLPPTVIGAEDLGDYGSWQESGEYGSVWYPRSVSSGWAPYQDGHWAWIDPWGWTWIDSMPWGFAPFHYGRWVYASNRWGWCPGPIAVGYRGPVIRPYYAPALVAWFGGAHFGVGISAGGGASLGWVPLGWGEVYTPSYHCSPRYFNNVNVYNTRIVNNVNITNVYNTVYVNKQVYNQQFVNVRAPNAVMSMPHAAFVSGRAVQGAAVPIRPAELGRVQSAAVVAPPVAPTRQSFTATASNRPAVRPAAQVVQRPVVARNTPPPAPASFAAREPYLQRQAGQPFNAAAVRSALPAAATTRPAVASVRPAPAARPVTVRPGEHVGAGPTVAGRPSTPQPQQPVQGMTRPVSPNQPAPTPRSGVSGPAEQPRQPAATPVTPAPAAHGMPPNIRQQQEQRPNEPANNGRYNQANPQPNRPAEPATNGRYNQTAPQPTRQAPPEPAYRAPQAPERNQAAPEHGAPPQREQQTAPQQQPYQQPVPQQREQQAAPQQQRYQQPVPQQREQQAAPQQQRYQQPVPQQRYQQPEQRNQPVEAAPRPAPQQTVEPRSQARPQPSAPEQRQERSQPPPQQHENKPAAHDDHHDNKPDHDKH